MYEVYEVCCTGHRISTKFDTYEEALAYAKSLSYTGRIDEYEGNHGCNTLAWVDITVPGCVPSDAYVRFADSRKVKTAPIAEEIQVPKQLNRAVKSMKQVFCAKDFTKPNAKRFVKRQKHKAMRRVSQEVCKEVVRELNLPREYVDQEVYYN